eukprot:TRINITY_DN32455_c0_g1_i1.p1 TRINITY_DN32455_c0_g1~~TRINITY_DN32455_c0_g1_i1.p1  ORF type:complete len:568 (+),score=198.89 TRINITY_DN32455_c0_g1_i1:71-1705(+)
MTSTLRRDTTSALDTLSYLGSTPLAALRGSSRHTGTTDVTAGQSTTLDAALMGQVQQARIEEDEMSAQAARDSFRDLFESELLRVQLDADEAHRNTLAQEGEMRYRIYRLANADMFSVRFVEEARWELRERREVIERSEVLERSCLRAELMDVFVEYLVVGGGEWSEDSARARLLVREERSWRRILQDAITEQSAEDERQWLAYLMLEDRWRWDVELELRQGMHQLQVDEHRRRIYLTVEVFPASINRLMHVMELEWVDLVRDQQLQYLELLVAHRDHLVVDEEQERQRMRRRNRRLLREFALLNRMLHVQHTEEFERRLTVETADRIFGVLFSRETVQIKALLERTRMLNDSVTAALAERSRMGVDRTRTLQIGGYGGLTPAPYTQAAEGSPRSPSAWASPASSVVPRHPYDGTAVVAAASMLDPASTDAALALQVPHITPVADHTEDDGMLAARTAALRMRDEDQRRRDRDLSFKFAEARDQGGRLQHRLGTLLRREADLERKEAARFDADALLPRADPGSWKRGSNQVTSADIAAASALLS